MNIEHKQSIALIDHDKQASSTGIARKTRSGSIQIHKACLTYVQNSGLTMLDAKSSLCNYSKNTYITIRIPDINVHLQISYFSQSHNSKIASNYIDFD